MELERRNKRSGEKGETEQRGDNRNLGAQHIKKGVVDEASINVSMPPRCQLRFSRAPSRSTPTAGGRKLISERLPYVISMDPLHRPSERAADVDDNQPAPS